MLKHPDLTLRRIESFFKMELLPMVIGERSPLAIEFCSVAHSTQAEAEAGPWETVQSGFRYGPAYRTVWFRVSGAVPKEWKGKAVALIADLGSERTVWRDNSPWWGLDDPHSLLNLHPRPESSPFVRVEAGKGAMFEAMIQAYTRNPQARVHGEEPPREELVETVERAELVVLNLELQDLAWDVEFVLDFVKALPSDDPSRAILLRALNDACNQWARRGPEAAPQMRKRLRDALNSLSGEVPHRITAVGHAHLDTAWLWPLEVTRKKMAHTTAIQLNLMERYPEHVFAHSQASQYEWLEQDYPKLFRRVKDAVKKGQWEPVGSMWVEADCNVTGGESLVRQFLYGRRYFREKLGYETQDMWLPDVFGYSAALPQILAGFGIHYFLTQKISWNQTNKFPHNTFLWQGIDGTRIWSHFPPADTYIGDCTPGQILHSVKNHKDHARSDHSLYLFGWGDGGGGPTAKHLEFLRRARQAAALPMIPPQRRSLDFFREARGRSRDLAVWVGELYLEMHRGTLTSQAENKKANRECEFLLRDAEMLACFRDDFPKKYPAKELEEAWKLVLLNQFHDIIPGSSVREVYEDSDRDYAKVREVGARIVQESLKKIASGMDTTGMKRPVAVFQNATMPGLVSLPWNEEDTPNSVVCGDESHPVQVVDDFGERKLIFSTPSTALCSAAVAELSDAAPAAKYRLKASGRRLENHELSVRFDANGNIMGIESLEDGMEFVERGKLANLFQLFDDHPLFWSAWDIDPFALETGIDLVQSTRFEIVERGPVRCAAIVEREFGKSRIRQKISLGPWPGIRFDTEVDWHESNKMLKVAFPVNINAARATYEIQFGSLERPTHRNTTWDMARFEVCGHKWADLSEGDHGVALLNDCKYGHDIHGNMMRLTLLRSPKAPDPICDMGTHRFTYVLMPHFGPHQYGGVVEAAYSLNAPARTALLKPNSAGEPGALPPFLMCEDRNIVIESVKRSEDGRDLIVRLYECHNSRGQAELFCLRQPSAAWLCDLEEKPKQELEVAEGHVAFSYRPFEIITIRLKI